jgi:hypothetical protein
VKFIHEHREKRHGNGTTTRTGSQRKQISKTLASMVGVQACLMKKPDAKVSWHRPSNFVVVMRESVNVSINFVNEVLV